MECDYCGNQIGPAKHRHYTGGNFDIVKETIPLPFTCRHCGGTFCADHRLPEFHECISLLKNSKFYISAELKNEIAENQVIDIPLYENLTPDEFKQYIAENSSEMDEDIVEHKVTDHPLYEYQTSDEFKQHITENSSEIDKNIVKHKVTDYPLYEYQTPNDLNHYITEKQEISENSTEMDKKTKILIAIMIAILIALYIILFVY